MLNTIHKPLLNKLHIHIFLNGFMITRKEKIIEILLSQSNFLVHINILYVKSSNIAAILYLRVISHSKQR